jgi:hypothetical protein
MDSENFDVTEVSAGDIYLPNGNEGDSNNRPNIIPNNGGGSGNNNVNTFRDGNPNDNGAGGTETGTFEL